MKGDRMIGWTCSLCLVPSVCVTLFPHQKYNLCLPFVRLGWRICSRSSTPRCLASEGVCHRSAKLRLQLEHEWDSVICIYGLIEDLIKWRKQWFVTITPTVCQCKNNTAHFMTLQWNKPCGRWNMWAVKCRLNLRSCVSHRVWKAVGDWGCECACTSACTGEDWRERLCDWKIERKTKPVRLY